MQDYELKILDQYPVEVRSTRKTRGAFFCDTDKGLLLLKEAGTLGKRVPALYRLHTHLKEQGVKYIDQFVKNNDGECVSISEDGAYVLKYWFHGRECDIRKSKELLEGAKNLAGLHLKMSIEINEYIPRSTHVKEEYLSHNRELTKVRKYVRGQATKEEFELEFLKCFDKMYRWAQLALDTLDDSSYETLYADSLERHCLTHGEYNYHNILMMPEGIATTNFDKCRWNVQAEDVYYYLRKAMEKNGWNVRLCDCILNAYCAVRPLSEQEMEYIKVRFIYPEKFWKIADSYYRSNKAWVPAKNIEKLKMTIMQTKEKEELLKDIFLFQS